MDFDFCVNRVDTKNASAIAYASKSTAKAVFHEFTLCVDSLDLAMGYEHLKVFYCC